MLLEHPIHFRCRLLLPSLYIKRAFGDWLDLICPFYFSQCSLFGPILEILKVLWLFQIAPYELWSPRQTQCFEFL